MSGNVRKVIVFVALFGFAFYSFFAIAFGPSDDNNVSGLHNQGQVLLVVWIALLMYFLYRSRGWIASQFQRRPSSYSFAPRRTPSILWRCPNCKAVLRKSEASMYINSNVMYGTITCGECGTQFSARDVYGGAYDV
jgi:hypothetical protein